MRTTARDIILIALFAVILHLPVFTGWIKPVPPNFTWWAPWNTETRADPEKGGYHDYLQEYLPWQKYLHESVHEGHLPLWNRYQFCGTPFVANRLLSPFYPPVSLGLTVPYELATYLMSFCHFLIGPIFMYLFLRRINLNGNAALVGAFVFCSSGMFVPFFPPWTAAIVWLPAVLFIVEGWVSGVRGWRDVPWLALILGFWFIQGYPVFVVHSLYFIILYILIISPAGRKLSTTGKFLVAFLLGGAISAIQNLPTLFFYLESARFAPEVDSLLELRLTVRGFLNHLMPTQSGAYIIGYNYLGIVPFLLIPFAAIRAGSRARYIFTWFAVCLALSFIPQLFVFISRILPFWSITPHPPIVPLFFSAAVLAAYGANRLWGEDTPGRASVLKAFVAAVIIFAAVLIVNMNTGVNKTTLFYSLGSLALVCLILITVLYYASQTWRRRAATGAIAAIIILAAVPWWLNMRQNRTLDEIFATPFYVDQIDKLTSNNIRVYRVGWQQNLPPNMSILWGIEDAGGYDSLILKRYHDAAILHGIHFYRGRETLALSKLYPADPQTLADMGIGILFASPESSGPTGEGWTVTGTSPRSVRLFINREIWRAGLIQEGKFVADAVPLDYSVVSPNEIRVGIGGDKGAGDVIVRDTYASGWKAWVDGKPVKIEIYREWQRKVQVQPGAQELVMKYDPVEFKVGALISAIAVFIALTGIAGGYRRRKTTESVRDEK